MNIIATQNPAYDKTIEKAIAFLVDAFVSTGHNPKPVILHNNKRLSKKQAALLITEGGKRRRLVWRYKFRRVTQGTGPREEQVLSYCSLHTAAQHTVNF